MNRAVEYMDVHSSTPPRRVFSPDEPATLVDVFTGIARNHKRPDTLNYKSNGRWVSVSSDELLARAKRILLGYMRSVCAAAIVSRCSPRAALNGR